MAATTRISRRRRKKYRKKKNKTALSTFLKDNAALSDADARNYEASLLVIDESTDVDSLKAFLRWLRRRQGGEVPAGVRDHQGRA